MINIHDKDILNVYLYGSRVYECHNDQSDFDYIVIADDDEDIVEVKGGEFDGDYTIYNRETFFNRMAEHEISVLECLYLPPDKILKQDMTIDLPKINLSKLRHSISAKVSNSFVKCKKKLTVEKDFDPHIGKKSLFHSLRIIMFGIQLAKHNKIVDYTVANKYWDEIVGNECNDWEFYKKTYKPIYNNLMTEFRVLAPK